MKFKVCIGSFLVISASAACFAGKNTAVVNTLSNANSQPSILQAVKTITPDFIYSYTDSKFNSVAGNNYNRFDGHSQLYSVGGTRGFHQGKVLAGLYLFKVNSAFDSEALLAPFALSTSQQSIKNTSIMGHVVKNVTKGFYVDVAGAYGVSKVNNFVRIAPDTPNEQNGFGKSSNPSWLASLTGIYIKTWDRWMLNLNLRGLYSHSKSGDYPMNFVDPTLNNRVLSLTQKVLWTMETAEVSYTRYSSVIPFLNGGLVQVPSFSTSRALIVTPINGILPQLSINQNGYKLGGGFGVHYKKLNIRIEQKYYRAGRVFTSNQTLLRVRYKFD